MMAETNAPTLIVWPLRTQPSPLEEDFPATELTRGVMMLSVKALIRVLKANATTKPTAMTIKSPCMRKFLKPLNMANSLLNRQGGWCVAVMGIAGAVTTLRECSGLPIGSGLWNTQSSPVIVPGQTGFETRCPGPTSDSGPGPGYEDGPLVR